MNRAARQFPPTNSPGIVKAGSRFSVWGVIFGAILMAWPAFYSGFPLMYPDTAEYIHAGRPVASAILLGHRSPHYGIRSLIYSLGILPFHPGGILWPVIMFQSLLTSWILWLVFRSLFPKRTWTQFALLMAVLSLFTSLSWFGSFVMPDILGPDLYLCVFLLVFAPESLSRVERALVYLVAWWSIVSHATHLMIVVALCGSLAVAAIFQPMSLRRYFGIAARLALLIGLAIGAQVSLNIYLYGKVSMNADRPPFLIAHLVADGTARSYLAKHCPQAGWELCHYTDNLYGTSNRFLWDADGVWKSATPDSRERLLQQESPLAKAIILEYPREQFQKTMSSFIAQLSIFDLGDFKPNYDIVLGTKGVLTHAGGYLSSRQAYGQMHLDFFFRVHQAAIIASLAGIALFLPWFFRGRPMPLIALGLVTAISVVANAFFTGALSMVAGRYESRVIWLVPLFAGLCFFGWVDDRKAGEATIAEPAIEHANR